MRNRKHPRAYIYIR